MLKIERDKKAFSTLAVLPLERAEIRERYDLQEYINNSPDAFFAEIGETLFIIGKELMPSATVQDRIDILALDKEGRVVIIELKRGSNKLHLLQAIAYAGMVAHWQVEDFFGHLGKKRKEELEEFLEVDKEDINREQRIILIAEDYDYSVLVSAEWLSERYSVDIMCCRIALAKDSPTNSEYLVCNIVFPAPELAGQAKRRRVNPPPEVKWIDWETALADVPNSALVVFFKQEVGSGRESYLPKRILRYRVNNKRRWFLAARRKSGYVWQTGRFADDVEFWRSGLTQADSVQPVNGDTCLRCFLSTEADFAFFRDAVTVKLQSKEWSEGSVSEDGDLDVKEDE